MCVTCEQVDGPTHFTNNTLRPLGPTLLKRRLLAARGWDVVPVPYFHWSQLSGEYERQLYVFSALQVRPGIVSQSCRAGTPKAGWPKGITVHIVPAATPACSS